MDLRKLLETALAQHRAGDLAAARDAYQTVLGIDPDNVDALHLLGVLENQSGRSEAAIQHIARAIALAPGFAEAHNSLGNVHRERAEWVEAGACFEKAVELAPQLAGAHLNLGLIARRKGDLEGALACYARALEIDPGFAAAHFNRANALQDAGRLNEAVAGYRDTLAHDSGFTDARRNLHEALRALGDQCLSAGEYEAAAAAYGEALDHSKGDAVLHNNLGNALRNGGNPEAAIDHYGEALKLDPDYAAAHNNLGNVLEDIGAPEQAIASYGRALEIDPEFAAAHNNMGNALRAVDHAEAALEHYAQALALDPQFLDAHFNRGHACKELGAFDEAAACYRRVLEIDPTHAGAYRHLTSLGFGPGGANAVEAMRALYDEGGLPEAARIELAFALGKALEDSGDYDAAFRRFAAGNAAHRRTYDYAISRDRDLMNRIKETFSAEFLAQAADTGASDPTPIFVLGMPRSGTSLVEQIVASHPDVFGGGELMFAAEAADGCGNGFPETVRDLDGDDLERLGAAYMKKLRSRAPAASRITDKMPHNFLYVGLIAVMLPKAKIVHCTRTPADTCLSMFKTLFTDRHDFAYDLTELGSYYGLYADFMAHWRRVLPERLFEVRYEDLVADQEPQTRRLLNHLELPWDDACLSFHRTQRRVATASSVQVRQGIYTDSVAAWNRYEDHLAPLLAALPPAEP